MNENGPIVLIEDDIDDIEMMKCVLKDLDIKNKFLYFSNPIIAMKYFKETTDQPFLVICDLNMPYQNGLEFKRNIDSDSKLKKKCMPFIFYSTSANDEYLAMAYTQMSVQGFFQKSESYHNILDDVNAIVNYWKKCKYPVNSN